MKLIISREITKETLTKKWFAKSFSFEKRRPFSFCFTNSEMLQIK